MSKPSKYAGAFTSLQEPLTTLPEAQPITLPAVASVTAEATAVPKASSRKPGKRTDPAYQGSFLYLRRDTLADVQDKLRRANPRRDASELVQELLENWLGRS